MQTDSIHLDGERISLLASALQVSYFTIVWNGVVGAAALLVGVETGSLALAAFALNTLFDSMASVVLVGGSDGSEAIQSAAERLERRAQTWVIAAMYPLPFMSAFRLFDALIDGSHPDPPRYGFGIALASLVVLPALAVMKLRLGAQLESPALRGDGVLTVAAAALAAVTLVALAANSLLDWWWADPAAALVVSAALAAEATRVAVRHRFG